MASGSTGRVNSGSKGFDFATDDILCSYDDYVNPDSNGNQSDSAIGSASSKDFLKSRMARSSKFPAPAYSPPEDSLSQDLISTVEMTMKKHTDGLMRFLEGISSRLSQLELCCYNLDKSVQEMRSELVQEREEADSKLKYLEKHVQEVHRSVQILRDKQELAETQKELAKLQLVQKESSSSSHHSQSNDERSSPAPPDSKKNENTSDIQNRQLALALPHQVAQQPHQQTIAPPSQPPPQQSYYISSTQLPNPQPQAPPSQQPQAQYMSPIPSESQYRQPPSQESDSSRMAPQPTPSQVNAMPPPAHSFPPQYQQQQWAQQQQQQLPPQQQVQPPVQNPQNRAPPTPVYQSYAPTQPNPPPPEMLPNSMPMQMPYSAVPQQPISSRASDIMPYGYNTPVRTTPPAPQQAPPQQIKGGGYGAPPPGDGYGTASGTLPPLPPGSAYMMYDNDGGRPHPSQQQSHYPQSGYHSSPNMPPQNLNLPPRNPGHAQFIRNHPHGELIEKLVSMGFRGDHAASVIQRMEESGQPVDFNSVLDRLDMHSSGGPQRGWSG